MAKDTTTFEKMGESVPHSLLNLSGASSPYTTDVPKGNGRTSQTSGTNAIKGRTMIKEANGPCFHIKTKLYAQNAAASGEQMRNVRILKPAIGDRDFRSRKTYGQGV